jgi:hypothetical protein
LLLKIVLPVLVLASAGVAGNPWKIGGRVGVRQNGNILIPTAAITAEYVLSDRLTWRTDFEAEFRDASHTDDFILQVPTHLLWHPLGTKAGFDPYTGPGVSVGMDSRTKATVGLNGVVGFMVRPRGQQAFGIEWRWNWPDLTRNTRGRWDAALVGNWEVKI